MKMYLMDTITTTTAAIIIIASPVTNERRGGVNAICTKEKNKARCERVVSFLPVGDYNREVHPKYTDLPAQGEPIIHTPDS